MKSQEAKETNRIPEVLTRKDYVSFFYQLLKVPEGEHELYITKLLKDSKDNSLKQLQSIEPELKVMDISYSLNFKVVIFNVRLNRFEFDISVINDEVNSRAHLLQRKQFKYSDLYTSVDVNEYCSTKTDFAVKCFKVDPHKDPLAQFCLVLRQYCYYRLASLLKVGPKLVKPFGFDLQVTNECIEFAMEKYESIQKAKPNFNKSLNQHEKALKQKLFRLHFLKITHNNIQPFNLLYNNQNDQFYLSDFCFCRFLPADIGTHVKTKFSGALNYVHPQMLEVYCGRSDQADLYINDAHCLGKSFSYLKSSFDYQQKLKQAGKRFRIQEIRDVYEDYGTYYNNIGSFYKKIDEVYDYLYSYYDLLKMFLSVHYQEDIFNHKEYMQAIEQFPEYSITILRQYSHCEYMNKVRDEIKKCLKDKSKSDEIEESLKVQQQIFSDENRTNNLVQTQLISKRIQKAMQVKQGDSIEKLQNLGRNLMTDLFNFNGGRYVRQAKIQRKIIVNNPTLILKLDQATYYKQFLKFIEIQEIRSTYDQKVKACQCFIKALKINQANRKWSDHHQLEQCLRHTLDFFIKKPCEDCYDVIPKIVTNLIISSTVTDSELIEIVAKLGGLKVNPIEKILMLFNVYCGVDWVRFKAVHTYSYKAVFQLCRYQIISALEKIRKEIQKNNDGSILAVVNKLVLAIIYSDTKDFQINSEIKQQMLDSVTKLLQTGIVNYDTANRMISLICLNAVTSQGKPFQEKGIVSVVSQIESLCPEMVDKIRIQSWHLRVYSVLQWLKSDNINLFSIKNKFWMTLQVPKLLNKYKLFYSEERSLYDNEQIPRLVKTLQNLCSYSKYKYCQDVILEWNYWLKWLLMANQHELYEYYLTKLKNIYPLSSKILEKEYYPPANKKQNYFLEFYHNSYQIALLYISIYFRENKENKEQKKNLLTAMETFTKELQKHLELHQFEGAQHIQVEAVHFINFIKLEMCFLKHKAHDALIICKKGIKQIKSSIINGELYLLHYIQKILKWGLILKKQDNVNKAYKMVSSGLQNMKLLPSVFFHQKALYILIFINLYSFKQPGNVDLFLRFHHQLLEALDQNPIDNSVQIYTRTLTNFLEKNSQVITDSVVQQIALGILRLFNNQEHRVKCNGYYCLLLSCLLQYRQIDDPLFVRIIKAIVKSIGSLTSLARNFILNQIFNFRLVKRMSNPQDKKLNRKQKSRMWFQVRNFSRFIFEEKDRNTLQKKMIKKIKASMNKKIEQKIARKNKMSELRKKWFDYLESEPESDDDDLNQI